jgi:SAM-dependent methyltransferase
VKSLNPYWTLDGFHARIVALAGLRETQRVLDLGCGRGHTLPHLLARIGAAGKAVAADRSADNLAGIRGKFHQETDAGRLSVVELDIAQKLPFDDASFDSVICQNVIECVTDKVSLVHEIHRILKPHGTALIGHHDFDGALIASDDRALTRRMVHGYADYTQDWQDVSDGQMGRRLPALVALSLFHEAETETQLFVDLTLSKESYARLHLDGMVALAAQFGVATETALAWLRALEARSDSGRFYYALPWVYVLARRGQPGI